MVDWRRAIVRVWHGRPNDSGVYLGTAFFVAAGYLLTCKHVIEGIPHREIYLLSDTGAWSEGGARKVQQPVMHPDYDVAYLPLLKPVQDACCISLAPISEADLHQGDPVQLAGYTTPTSGVETVDGNISTYAGDYDLEVMHSPIGKGMSGGPALRDGRLVGITRAKDDVHTFIVRVNSFRNFLPDLKSANPCSHRRSFSHDQLAHLKDLLKDAPLDNDKIIDTIRKITPLKADRLRTDADNLLSDAIELLSDCPHQEPDHAPLLEFLLMIPIPPLPSLDDWQLKIAETLNLELERIKNNVLHMTLLQAESPPVLLVKIEPDQLISDDKFRVRTWLYLNGAPHPLQQEEGTYKLLKLEQLLPNLLSQARKRLSTGEAQELLVEVIAPLVLWCWNFNRVPAQAGPLKQPLGKLYPLALRSWERIYHQDYDSVRYQWEEKWNSCLCGANPINSDLIHPTTDANPDCQSLYDKLTNEYLVFAALFPITSMPETLCTLFGTVLAAGLPFAFWPLGQAVEPDVLRVAVQELVETQDHNKWMKSVHTKRKSADQLWQDIQLLWDNPERIPPDVTYRLLAPE